MEERRPVRAIARRPDVLVEDADGAAYADVVSEYAAPERDELLPPTSGRG
jgi:hypothetical protein